MSLDFFDLPCYNDGKRRDENEKTVKKQQKQPKVVKANKENRKRKTIVVRQTATKRKITENKKR